MGEQEGSSGAIISAWLSRAFHEAPFTMFPRPRRRSCDSNVADRLVVELDDPAPPSYSSLPPPYSPLPANKPKSPPPPPAAAPKARVSSSELRVLLYLYRTVLYGLELRNIPSPQPIHSPIPKRKPLGPRSSPSASRIPSPELKSVFESTLAAASAAKRIRGFANFPLIEDDLDSDHHPRAPPRTPFHSPRSSPPPFLNHPSKKEKSKADINSELHVQDALLALRLRDFLRAQGVSEKDLTIAIDQDDQIIKPDQSSAQPQDDNEECNILEEYFMGIEEEEHNLPPKKERGPLVEDDDDPPPVIRSSPSPPPLRVSINPPGRIMSVSPPPPPLSPRPHAVLPTSYMVALLTMRNRHPTKKPSGAESSRVKKKSGLSVVVEVD